MLNLDPTQSLQSYAENLIDEHNIPAVSLAVWKDGKLSTAAAGILNLTTGVEATTDSIFQIGSISKVITASLVMQLVDEGKIDLEKTVKHYLQDFQITDPKASNCITVRQLLNHTNGIAGDFFPDDHDAGGNHIARYVDRCNQVPLIHPVGEYHSYSNTAFATAGRLVEVVSGVSWYQAVRDYIFKPLGMHHAIANPIDVIRHRVAMGHVFNPENPKEWVLPEKAYLTLGTAPAGATVTMSTTDLIIFARAHLEGGKTQNGDVWLSENAINAMQVPGAEWPRMSKTVRKHFGLAWSVTDYPDQSDARTISHAGGTNGQMAMLRICPEKNAVFAVLINSYSPSVIGAITNHLMKTVLDIDCSEPEPVTKAVDEKMIGSLCGTYHSMDRTVEVSLHDNKLMASVVYHIDPLPPAQLELRWVEDNVYAAYTLDGIRSQNVAFIDEDTEGKPLYLFMEGRLNGRI